MLIAVVSTTTAGSGAKVGNYAKEQKITHRTQIAVCEGRMAHWWWTYRTWNMGVSENRGP